MEEAEVTESQETVVPVEEVAEPVVERPPGGADDLSVYGRKMNAEAKKAREEATALREDNIRLQERVRLAEEAKKEKPAEKVYTLAAVNALVASGQLTRENADIYIEDVIIPAKAKAVNDAEKQRTRDAEPIEAAQKEINDWLAAIPELRNDSSEVSQRAGAEYQKLMARGMPHNPATMLTAIEKAHGSLDAHKKRQAMNELTRQNGNRMASDAGGGSIATNGKIDMSKAPSTLVSKWDKLGVTPEARARQFKIYLDKQKEAAGK